MTAQLRAKLDRLACPVDILEIDLETAPLDRKFDGVMSSMTLHHIKDVPVLLRKLHGLLHDGAFLAIADLQSEDGTFHNETMGVHHNGFAPQALVHQLDQLGYRDITASTVSVIHKQERD